MAQIDALIGQYRRDRENEWELGDFRVALVCAHILNTIPRTKKNRNKVFQPWDIFPSYRDKWKPRPTPEQLNEKINLTMMSLGSKKKGSNG